MNIITYGSFDLLHYGHLLLLNRCRKLADGGKLIVGLSSESFNTMKGKKNILTYEERYKTLELLGFIDEIISEDNRDQKKDDAKKYNAKIVMGSDWSGKFDDVECIYLPRTEGISTTDIVKRILNNPYL